MNNSPDTKKYEELANKLLDGTITEGERHELMHWLNSDENTGLHIPQDFASTATELEQRMINQLKTKIKTEHQSSAILMRRSWWAAASVIILLGVAAYLWNIKSEKNTRSILAQKVTDATPGRAGAILTLQDGRQLILDSLGNGVIAQQGETSIIIQDGQLLYHSANPDDQLVYNTMSTPKGRQYHLVLNDGTKVWLNAASSITYPAAFTGKERRVKVSGEAYFEVEKNAAKPFFVDVDGKAGIQVLGTSFNVSAYGDEQHIRTTLLTGKIKLVTDSLSSVILNPLQQSVINRDSPLRITTALLPDANKVMAWKNGVFNFDGVKISEVMKQLERWYDITVIYEKGVPDIEFFGEINRNINLSDLILILKDVGVHFRIESGKKLVVYP